MSISDHKQDSVEPSTTASPRPDQLATLRRLVAEREVTMAYPQTEAEAHAEIAKLEGRLPEDSIESWIACRGARRQVAAGSRDAASVRESEIAGHGGSSRWRYPNR